MGIPGMGKTTFINNQLREFFEITSECNFTSISNDEIRRELINKYLRENPNKTAKDAFDATHRETVKIFNQTLAQKIQQAIKDDGNDIYVICLDKNHPPPIIAKTIEVIDKALDRKLKDKINLMKIALVPDQPHPHRGFPFSLSLLVQCYQRCLEREKHDTLTNEDPNHLARVLFLFFKQY